MLQPATVAFLSKLEKNNNKPWFDANRKEYETAKADFETFVADLLEGMAKLEPALQDQKAKDCIFRIFRDVRFSKDKTPYKAHFSAVFSKGGRKHMGAGYYIHLQPGGKSFAGGGIWMPENHILKSIRQEIDYNFKEFNGIITSSTFKKLFKKIEGEQLKTLPQGYSADNPAIDYLKMKSFTVGHNLSDKDALSKAFVSKCLNVFTVMKPLVDFLNRSFD